jgi:hypothetical protein
MNLKDKMSLQMWGELLYLKGKEPTQVLVELVELDRDGCTFYGAYLGKCAPGERIHRIDTEYDSCRYIRSRATAPEIKRFLSEQGSE